MVHLQEFVFKILSHKTLFRFLFKWQLASFIYSEAKIMDFALLSAGSKK